MAGHGGRGPLLGVQHRLAPPGRPGPDVFDQLGHRLGVADHPAAGHGRLHPGGQVRARPGALLPRQDRHRLGRHPVPVHPAHRHPHLELDRPAGPGSEVEPGPGQLDPDPLGQLLGALPLPRLGLAAVRPRLLIPAVADPLGRLPTRMSRPPGRLHPGPVGRHQPRPFRQQRHRPPGLVDLPIRAERVPLPRQHPTQPDIADQHPHPQLLHGPDVLADGRRMQPMPAAVGGFHPGVDHQMHMPVRVALPAGQMGHPGRLHRQAAHLHLAAPRPDPGHRHRRQIPGDLVRLAAQRAIQRRRHHRVLGGHDRQRLRVVDRHLHKPQRQTIRPARPDTALHLPRGQIDTLHPPDQIARLGQHGRAGPLPRRPTCRSPPPPDPPRGSTPPPPDGPPRNSGPPPPR